jgi:LysM repeat protein
LAHTWGEIHNNLFRDFTVNLIKTHSFTPIFRCLPWLPLIALSFCLPAFGQVEPGLEKAVHWQWRVEPSDPADWGLPIPIAPPPAANSSAPVPNHAAQTNSYQVTRGDALVLIAKKFTLTVPQLKLYNGLTTDLIHPGDILKIPSHAEAERLSPSPPPPAPKGKAAREKAALTVNAQELETTALQAFLDREQFSAGPIDGKLTPAFGKVLYLYQSTHPDLADPAALNKKVRATVGDGFTTYKLRPEDFRYIAPPAAARAEPGDLAAKPDKIAKPKPATAERARQTYDSLVRASMLAYSTPWEFVAERFHCDEAFLRKLNNQIKIVPSAGTEFRVPNVTPFAIEAAFVGPLQPQPDPQTPITAAALDLSLLQIFRKDQLIAVMPLSVARPGLHGKGTWTILNAMPRPRLATRQEEKEKPAKPAPLFGQPSPEPSVPPKSTLASDQYLAAGPNNPLGIIWIDLAKSDDPKPLPYGLHGTSTPDQMKIYESLGGFRLTNWDILRAARLLPPGTPLEWKQTGPAPAAPL